MYLVVKDAEQKKYIKFFNSVHSFVDWNSGDIE